MVGAGDVCTLEAASGLFARHTMVDEEEEEARKGAGKGPLKARPPSFSGLMSRSSLLSPPQRTVLEK